MADEDLFGAERHAMVERQIRARGIDDPALLDALREVPRHCFVEEKLRHLAYRDRPLPIGEGQTISQPYIVALMIDAADIRPDDRVLEVGAGSGYATAILARLAREVVAIERHEALANETRDRLVSLQIANVDLRCGDGSLGVPDRAPFDVIIVSASGPDVPPSLIDQLAPGGRLIMPVGSQQWSQSLILLVKDADGAIHREELCGVQFVPLVGAEGHRP